jgi:6-pyruvoyltetrahydropterin/6-carboxytetrahydropterin synthase
MDITVAGEIDPLIGYVMDLTELKELVENVVISKVDHKNLNLDVDFMNGVLPSTENIAVSIWNQLEKHINNNRRKLYSVKIRETINNSVEYRG